MNSWFSHPMEELSHLRHSLDEVIKSWTTPFHPSTSSNLEWGWKPRMDVCENRGFYKIIVELPGFQKEDLDVQVNGRFLSIKGFRPESHDSEWRFHRRERYSGGEFHRAVALPEGIDGSSIQAKYFGGMLTLLVPKTGGKITQHVSLLGKEEHANKRYVIEAEERERRRRMEENDPMLSRSAWEAGRIGTVIDEENERYRRIHEEERLYKNKSRENRKLSSQLEYNEKQRRIKDTKGEAEKKKNALKVSRFIKSLGVAPKSRLHKTNYIYKHTLKNLEEKERAERIRDKKRQREQMATAKRVSNMIKQSGGVSRLHHTQYSYLKDKKPFTSSSFNKNLSFNKKSNTFLTGVEEKERERRLKDKKGQQEAKRLAHKISDMIGSANF
eukprot:gene6769-8394_t